ncbi:MAG: adenylate/guanylate cyclase domain-containing protein [Nitrospirae bacterium]|nr:MAG: adenylate/guanylate cyclase domain-containing protein [Nitrospirota bacterium]
MSDPARPPGQLFRSLTGSPVFAGLVTGLLIFAAVILARAGGYLQAPELSAYDYFLRQKVRSSAAAAPITLVAITEADIQKLNQWPLTDSLLADLLRQILKDKPRAIGLDLYRDIPVPPGSDKLRDVISKNPHIVTVMKIGDRSSGSVPPPYMIKDPSLIGFNDLPVDRDGSIRRGLLFMDGQDGLLSSFGLLLALNYLQPEGIGPQPDRLNPEHMRLGGTTFVPFRADDGGYRRADAGGYQVLLDFRSRPFTTLTLGDVLDGKADPAVIQDRVVLIGSTAESMKDMYAAPVSGRQAGVNILHGVEIHSHLTGQIIRAAQGIHKSLRPLNEQYAWAWICLWSLAAGLAAVRGRSYWAFGLFLAGGTTLLTGLAYWSFMLGWWIPVIPPAVSWVLTLSFVKAYLSYREKNDRVLLMQLFSRHVSKDVAETIWRERQNFIHDGRLIPRKLTATVLFTDISGFTAIAERSEPGELMTWLNRYMDAMTGTVMVHNGVVNKFIGDAIMAVFGVPVAHDDDMTITADARNAVACALEMKNKLADLNREWENEKRPTIRMRVGIHTGSLVAGSLGGAERMEYTVIGDTVNIASRLEGLRMQPGDPSPEADHCRILISEATRRLLGNAFMTSEIGEFQVKGRDEKIMVYRVSGVMDKNTAT